MSCDACIGCLIDQNGQRYTDVVVDENGDECVVVPSFEDVTLDPVPWNSDTDEEPPACDQPGTFAYDTAKTPPCVTHVCTADGWAPLSTSPGGTTDVAECCEPFTAPNGEQAQPVGCFYDATATLDGAGDFSANAPAASGYPEFWRQCVTNGLTGSEVWVVMADTTGVLQWHQLA